MLPGLGDLLCAVPALAGLRRLLPTAHVTFIGRRTSRWFADRFPDLIDGWIGCDWCPGLVESADDPGALAGVLAEAGRRPFDVAIQLHGDGTATNAFTAALGARHWAGLARRPADHRRAVPADTHEIDRCVEAVRATGLRIEPGPLLVPLGPDDDVPEEAPRGASSSSTPAPVGRSGGGRRPRSAPSRPECWITSITSC
ncbi:hypothetical protein BH18ACT2_BH18ACT2_18640 [soil metagenome]